MPLPPLSPDAMLVAAVLLGGFGIIGILSSRAEGRVSWSGAVLCALSGFFGYSAWHVLGGVVPSDIPNAFVHVLAAALR